MFARHFDDITKRLKRDPLDLPPMQMFGDCTDDFALSCQQSFDNKCDRMVGCGFKALDPAKKVEAEFKIYSIALATQCNTVNRWVFGVLQWDTGAWCGAVRLESTDLFLPEVHFDEA